MNRLKLLPAEEKGQTQYLVHPIQRKKRLPLAKLKYGNALAFQNVE
jgi:hypothetical protein